MSLTPAPNWSPADWVVSGLRGFSESVLSLVPSGFECYVRIFHPAARRAGRELERVSWAGIAAANGKRAHPAMQLTALTGSFDSYTSGQPGVFDVAPRIGSLPEELVEPLTTVLAGHLPRTGRCWFAFWEGFGGLRHEIALGPAFTVPHRRFHLLSGGLDGLAESATDFRFQSASLWWPDDRAWCVATEIDLNTTYVGCDGATREGLWRAPELEAMPIDPRSGIDFASDAVNTAPGEGR
jgi:hypothetical protein